jgi:general stress protein YciG
VITEQNGRRRGFASMSPQKQREIASKGGRAAHEKGAAHEWTVDEARTAGRKGGYARHRRRSVVALGDAFVAQGDALEATERWSDV